MGRQAGGSPAPSLPLDAATMARWGIVHHPDTGRLSLSPALNEGAQDAAVGPFRAGRTVVALLLRRTPSAVLLRITVSFGPPIRVEARLADPEWDVAAVVDDIPLGRPQVAFEASGTHEIIWRH
ncbi:MAG TPA: hypothetical protein VMK53_07070 [Gemmatimonadales bacterium]|nr:hypothetical protein [Gemmatimonadales bacterium]